MKHLIHVAIVAGGFLLVTVPTVIATPAARSLLAHHPAVAGYMAAAAGIVSAALAAWKTYRAKGAS